jgi:serine/threonine protein kinase
VFLFRPYDESEETFKESNYAIKVFKKPEYYKQELKTFLNIKSRFDEGKLPTQFIDLVASFPKNNSIVYKPVGKKIHNLDKRIILEIFDAVKELHIRGIIHRDLSYNHFYQV